MSLRNHDGLFSLTLHAEELKRDGNGIVWHDNGNELEVENTYYEVINIKSEKNLVTIQLLKDKTETELFFNFLKLNKEKSDLLISFFQMLFGSNFYPSDNPFQFTVQFKSNVSFRYTASLLTEGIKNAVFHPPSC